jgi:nickel-dependent lactate racemase
LYQLRLNGKFCKVKFLTKRKIMAIQIPYGKEHIPLQVPDHHLLGVFHPNTVQIGSEEATVLEAMAHPLDSPSLPDFLEDARDVAILVNDATRPTPTAKVLEIIQPQIEDANVNFIIATGNHRGPTEVEFSYIFGDLYEHYRDRIYVHDAHNTEEMVFLGTCESGTEMYVNRLGVEAHKLIVISSVEPHYFAGYTGGRKSFLPGIAAYRTIEQNHRKAILPEARLLDLKGNPVHEDMIDALNFIQHKEIFSIQTVLDRERRIYAASAGNIHTSFEAAIDKANEVYAVKVPEKADVVVSVAPYPMDIDLYQSQKALETGKLALKKGGILLMVSKCRMGTGDRTFMDLLMSAGSAEAIMDRIAKGYILGYHKAAKIAEINLWAEIWAKTDLPPEIIKSVHMHPVDNLQEALDKALALKGAGAKVLVLADGSNTVPILE